MRLENCTQLLHETPHYFITFNGTVIQQSQSDARKRAVMRQAGHKPGHARRKEYEQMKLTRKYYYMDIQNGNLVTLDEMLELLESEYGFDDFTPMSELWNYFELTEDPVRQ